MSFTPPAPKLGNVCVVDAVNGNPATASRGGLPFLTITAALAAALAGDVVWVLPGTYAESISVPANVSVDGLDRRRCIIDRTAIGVATDIVTLAAGSRISNMMIAGSTAAAVQLRGVVIGNVASAVMRNCTVSIDHIGAGTAVGVATSGGTPAANFACCQYSEINVSGSLAQIRRGILVGAGGGNPIFEACLVLVTRAGGAVGTYYAAEVSSAGASLTLQRGTYQGPTGAGGADVSQTAGTLSLDGTTLGTLNANGLGFSAPSGTWTEWWGDIGTPTVGATRNFRSGTATVQSTELGHDVKKPQLAIGIIVRSRVGAGGGQSSVFTLRKSTGGGAFANTTLTASLAGGGPGGTTATNVAASVSFVNSDAYSMQVVTSAASGVTDVQVGTVWYTG